MKYHYSKSKNSFYPEVLLERYKEAGTLPEDIVGVSEKTFKEFSNNKEGFKRVPDSNGYPSWKEIPKPSDEELLQQKRKSMVVSKFQAKVALKQAGLLDQVQHHIATLPEDDLTRIAWEDAQEFRRLSPTIDAVTTTLNLTDTQVDDLFEQAKYIEA